MSTITFTPIPSGTGSSFARYAPRAARPAAAMPAASPRLRLTRRGRTVLMLLLAVPLALWLAFSVLNGGGATAGLEPGAPVPVVVVQPGESLWSLAERIAPASDPRDVIDAIVSYNHLPSADVMAGQSLGVPAPYGA